MMVSRPLYTPFVDVQAGVLADTRQHFAALQAAERRAAEYPGWMFWKKYPTGRNYLIHAYDRTGRGTMLGGETPENAERLERFKQEQQEAKLRLKFAKTRMEEHARFIKAARLNRFPRKAAAVVRAIEQDPARQVVVLDAHAFFAYESLLGVLFTPSLTGAESLVVALKMDGDPPVASEKGRGKATPTLAQLLRDADRSFTISEDHTSAATEAGFQVELLDLYDAAFTARLNPLGRSAPLVLTGPGHEPSPTIREMVIDQDGWPLGICVPDPRIFAAHQQLLAEEGEGGEEERARNRYRCEAVNEALRARRTPLPALQPLPDISDTARLGAILQELDLAGMQGVLR